MTRAALLGILFLVSRVAPAQSSDLRFEAASVKPAAPQDGGGWRSSIDRPPGRYRATNMSLRRLLANAFGLKEYQLQTPGWMDDARYDISAKAAGTPAKGEIDVMVQNLLVERFRIELHREQKEMPVFKLGIGKNGPRLKETTIARATAQPEADAAAPPSAASLRKIMASRARDANGFPVLDKPGAASRGEDGRTKMTAIAFSIAQLTAMLSTLLQRDVVDETGLTGKYDFHLEYANDDAVAPAVPLPVLVNRTATEASGPSIFKALQDQLGLKLEPGKALRDLLVIDRAEKTPIEN
jgi:uncharacterized protein (TIGR03435 family)